MYKNWRKGARSDQSSHSCHDMSNTIQILPKELLDLIRHGENYQIEYKEATIDLPKSLFDSIGYADELGSGMRNSYKYTLMYSGAEPEFIERDIFKIIIPLSVGSMIKVGPGTSPVTSGEVSGEVSGEADSISIKLDIQKLNALLNYLEEPKTRNEMQVFCGIRSQDYFRRNILVPLLNSKRIVRTIPDKPNSSKQKYVKK